MFRRNFSLLEGLCKARLLCHLASKRSNVLQAHCQAVPAMARGNSTLISVNQPTNIVSLLYNPWLQNEHLPEVKFPKHSTIYSELEMCLPSLKCFGVEHKQFSSIDNNFYKRIQEIRQDYIQEETEQYEIEDKIPHSCYWMGSLLKKRRRKMNRQKYKKRRKRDRFKREALKNLREKKQQRKERAEQRKQAILSTMVVNKSISKRRARYLSHKLLPGVIKGQGLG